MLPSRNKRLIPRASRVRARMFDDWLRSWLSGAGSLGRESPGTVALRPTWKQTMGWRRTRDRGRVTVP